MAMKSFKSDAAALMLFDERKEFLTISASIGLDPDYVRIVKVGRGEEISGKVIESRRPRLVPDMAAVFEKIGDHYSYEKIKKEQLCSFICAPIITKDEDLGCLNIYYRKKLKLDETEISALSFFCNLSAIAIENAQFHKQTKEKLQDIIKLSGIGLNINSLRTIDEITHAVLKTAVETIDAPGGSIMVLKNNNTEVDRAYYYNKKLSPLPRPYKSQARLTDGITGFIIKDGRPICISDTQQSPLVNPRTHHKEWRSVVGVPLKIKDKLIGILFVNDTRPLGVYSA